MYSAMVSSSRVEVLIERPVYRICGTGNPASGTRRRPRFGYIAYHTADDSDATQASEPLHASEGSGSDCNRQSDRASTGCRIRRSLVDRRGLPNGGTMRRQSDEPAGTDPYAAFIRLQSDRRASGVACRRRRSRLGRAPRSGCAPGLKRSFGRMPDPPCPLEPEILGTLVAAGYAIERLTFQSRPGVRVTANLYRPDPVQRALPGGPVGPRPLGLGSDGPARSAPLHRPGQAGLCRSLRRRLRRRRAGDRAGPGTYHGGLVGASLWPVGTPLIGLQVYDNRRAVDYLISRPEVDASRLAITGASGGGNQTLYAGATDERLTAVIPVCGIGTYDAYLTTACCVCEINAGGAVYATTGDLLAMVAPAALLVISATRDAFQFSVGEAAKSVARGTRAVSPAGRRKRRSAISPSNPATITTSRCARRCTAGSRNGCAAEATASRSRSPRFEVEEIDALRCYPDGRSRPKTIVTIPEFAHNEGTSGWRRCRSRPTTRSTGTPRPSGCVGAPRPDSGWISRSAGRSRSQSIKATEASRSDHDRKRHPLDRRGDRPCRRRVRGNGRDRRRRARRVRRSRTRRAARNCATVARERVRHAHASPTPASPLASHERGTGRRGRRSQSRQNGGSG